MPTIRRCCIVGCMSNSRQHPQLQFFQFPRPENPFHKLWKQACHASLSRILPFKKPVVCALHFQPNCIGGRRLTSSAVPSLRLEVPSNLKDVEQQAMFEEIERSRKCAYINAVVFEWLVRANLNPQLRGSITHGMIKEKADSAKQLIGSTSFVADNRWLNRFRETHLAGFAQRLASDQLKPRGTSLWIRDIVQELQDSFPPTRAERVANMEEMPEQYINYMQQYGEYEEDDDNDVKDAKDTSYQEQQQQTLYQQQHYQNNGYDSFGQQPSYGYDQYSYERQQQQHHQHLQQQQQHYQQQYQQQHHYQQQQQQQQYQQYDMPSHVNYGATPHPQQQRSASNSPPAMPSPYNRRSPSSLRASPTTTSVTKRPRIETPNSTGTPRGTPTPTALIIPTPVSTPTPVRTRTPTPVPTPTQLLDNSKRTYSIEDLTDEAPIDPIATRETIVASASTQHATTNGNGIGNDDGNSNDSGNSNSSGSRPSSSNGNGNANGNSNDDDNDNDNANANANENTNDDVKTDKNAKTNGSTTPTNSHATSVRSTLSRTSSSTPSTGTPSSGVTSPTASLNGKTNGIHQNGTTSSASSTASSAKELDNYTQALKYLKPLEDFALIKENFRAIGLISQLEAVLRRGAARLQTRNTSLQNGDHSNSNPSN